MKKIKTITSLTLGLIAIAPLANAKALFDNTFSISQENSVDYLDFTLDSPQSLDIYTNGPESDPVIYLFEGPHSELNADSKALATNDDGCPDERCGPAKANSNALIDIKNLEAGDYTVAVSDHGVISEGGDGFLETEAIEGENGAVREGDITVDVAIDDELLEKEVEALAAQSSQITRHTTNMIAQRLSRNITKFFTEAESENKIAGSSDVEGKNTALWGSFNYLSLTTDTGSSDIDTGIYQFLGGFDKAVGNLFFGTALTYAYTEHEITGLDTTTHTGGITPYVAYKLNDFMFISGLVGYNYTGVISPGPGTGLHEIYTEADLSVFKEINSFMLKGRAGIRYSHNFLSDDFDFNNTSADLLTYIVDTELDYRFDFGLTAYTGILYEFYDRDILRDESVVYMRFGADYQITDDLSIGAIVETDLYGQYTSIVSGGVNIRLEI
ncbi:MAG: autotransporter outer membrane beta-barrel domain-containing protein [Methyloprofundus sp.]|nr:autotransporter outer membrane beta-barrel domain-containing protein [Methyloprofundus sp.]